MRELTDEEIGAATRVILRLNYRPAIDGANEVRILGETIIDPGDGGLTWSGTLQARIDSENQWFVDDIQIPEGYVGEDQEDPWVNWVASEVEGLLNREPGVELLRRRFGG